MADKNGKQGKLSRWAKRIGGALLSLLLMAAVCLAAVLLQSPEETKAPQTAEESAPAVTRMQSAAMDDPAALAGLFGCPLPALPGQSCRGQAGNSAYDGSTARVACLIYDDAAVYAVQPAAAAPLLLRERMEVSVRGDLTVLGLPALLAESGQEACLYFSNETAAYAFYTPAAGTEALLSLARQLAWTP
ncbi:MAG: hypothetical protein J5472_06100 [Clostridia bacterium]|nr:hypothetical protein [Clostridia bacterium]MCR4885595.1 hypothetical protein [Clostridiales bacterium]